MRSSHGRGRLYLNGQAVGNIFVRGWDGAWGFGEFQPIDPGTTDEAYARNRRIELKLTER